MSVLNPFVALPPSTTRICATGWKRRLSAPPIELVEIERLRYQEMPISASRVRQLLAKNDLTAIAPLVPAVTLHYLQNLLEHSRQDAAARQKTPA
ncbi:hypothetical protein ACLK1X_03690 [Escherichia coli]